MASLRSQLESALAELAELRDHLAGCEAEVERLNDANLKLARAVHEAAEWQSRAHAAEDDLTNLRAAIRAHGGDLRDVTKGGPVVYRRDVADALIRILDE